MRTRPYPAFLLVLEERNLWSIGGHFSLAFCRTKPNTGLLFSFRLEGMKSNLKTYSRSGLAGQIAIKRNISSEKGGVNARIPLFLFTVLKRTFV